ncbi:hypothetical protein SPRG_10683 [Saprolegnia parasitica CBS 223.65]|uniref:PDZ domain-containing protein n=1 Tax=Saprolegnia parasitica (strain CBS 223.65) TaxID=695850 RepID=A0A067CBQ8_SAPPC|nr:hypothetical protein SPRG_10683 [Saprolegnia parasitica CBS 223.65]KDO23986.1 hypothetical protein SPRG_10683 [Saprolegnia parasitica CBS 223.65]|eukprot:XP_012205307.1 hypothetical protein SPRG_10683 [Saprolegnia parasitica CBS 223.65]
MEDRMAALSVGDQISVLFFIAGHYQRFTVRAGMKVSDVIAAMANVLSTMHPEAEVPVFNAIRNNKTARFVALNDSAIRALEPDQMYDIVYTDKAAKVPLPPPSSVDPTLEFQIVFYSNPLGITIKPMGDRYVVATKKKSLDCYRRLVVGMEVVSCGGVALAGVDFRELHSIMANSTFPLTMRFRAAMSDRHAHEMGDDAMEGNQASERQRAVDTFNMPVPVIYNDDSSVHSMRRRIKDAESTTSYPSSLPPMRPSSAVPDLLEKEARLEETLKSLQEAFYKKKKELDEIVERIGQYSSQLSNVRATMGKAGADSHASPNTLTQEMLRKMDSAKTPLPRKKGPASVVSNSSSTSARSTGSYARHMHPYQPAPAKPSSRIPTKPAMSSAASVCSLTSTCSIDRMAFKKPRPAFPGKPGAAGVRKTPTTTPSDARRANAANTNAFSNTFPSSFSTKGGLISRAQTPRGAFLVPKTNTPGVGHYDVKDLSKNIKGGEIGDSDRDLHWA